MKVFYDTFVDEMLRSWIIIMGSVELNPLFYLNMFCFYFVSTAAIKFARKYSYRLRMKPSQKDFPYKILSFSNAFHGRTLGALSATPNEKYQIPFKPLVPGFHTLPYNDIPSLDTIDFAEYAAVIVEPVQGEGGIRAASPEFLKTLRSKCDANGTLLIYDEIQCGLGRTGTLFAHRGITSNNNGEIHNPDLITLAKPLANGVPIGAVLLAPRVAESIKPGDHGTTFGGNPFATRVGQVVLSKLQEPGFLEGVQRKSEVLHMHLNRLVKMYPDLATEVRGKGLLVGLQLNPEKVDVSRFVDLAREMGKVLVISAAGNTLRIVPPLVISEEAIEKACGVFEQVLEKFKSEGSK
jgi:acetylornithine/succinyldiaminopimelate/putrescine aminotransferase